MPIINGVKTVSGAVNGLSAVATATPTITAGAYSAKDFVGGKLTFNLSAEGGVGSGVTIQSVTIADESIQRAQLVLYLFDADLTTTVTDNAAATLDDADLPNCLGFVTIYTTDYTSLLTDNDVAFTECNIPAGEQVVYGFLVCTGTPTYASTSDLIIRVGAQVD